MGKTVPEVLSTAQDRNTDRPRPVNNIFIFSRLRFKSFCVEVGRVRVDEARDRLQTKQNNTT